MGVTSIHDRNGRTTAWLDGPYIHERGGRVVGFIQNGGIFNYAGTHLGYFEGGWFRDRQSRAVACTPNPTGSGPVAPVPEVAPRCAGAPRAAGATHRRAASRAAWSPRSRDPHSPGMS